MKRRSFIQLSSAVSALAASGHLPLLAAGQKVKGLPAIEPVSSAVRRFSPVDRVFSSHSDFELVYDLVRWHYRIKGTVNNKQTGRLRIQRAGAASEALYTVRKNAGLPNKQDTFLLGALETEGPLDVPRKWMVKRRHTNPDKQIQPSSRVTCQGEFRDGTLVLKNNSFTTKKSIGVPLILQWALPSILAQGIVKDSPLMFCMLDDGLKCKPDQKLEYCGEVAVPTAQGDVPFDAYLQTGTGILPSHWLVDAQGRTQVMTQSVMNWILKDIIV